MLLVPPAWAQYMWKDSRGQVHASDQPPPREVPDKDILKRPGPARPRLAEAVPTTASGNGAQAASTASAAAPGTARAAANPATNPASGPAKAPVDPELEARRKRGEQEAQARQQAEDAKQATQRADNCQRARQQLAGLESGQRIARLNERGERVVMDDATRAAEVDLARRVIASDCR